MSELSQLVIYRNLLQDEVIQWAMQLEEEEAGQTDGLQSGMISRLIEFSETCSVAGDLLQKYVLAKILNDENIFTLACEKGTLSQGLKNFALKDITALLSLTQKDFGLEVLKDYRPYSVSHDEKSWPCHSPQALYKALEGYHSQKGCGDMAVYHMFRLDEKGVICGIKNYDHIELDDLIGYEYQKQLLVDNTEAFLQGFEANNVLLAGSRGTGKSSSVKAVVNRYASQKLRLIEISKEQIRLLPGLLNQIKNRGLYFILFLDDLSFEDYEVDYKIMKSILEGGAEKKPANTIFYATTNRRNIIQERWKDRDYDDVHTNDSMNEKISLSDRFGLTIAYTQPTPEEYVQIAVELIHRAGIQEKPEDIRKLAMRWELERKGMSGRSARQFVNHFIWEYNKKKK